MLVLPSHQNSKLDTTPEPLKRSQQCSAPTSTESKTEDKICPIKSLVWLTNSYQNIWYFNAVIWAWLFSHCLKTMTNNVPSAENQAYMFWLSVNNKVFTFCCWNSMFKITSFQLLFDLSRLITSHVEFWIHVKNILVKYSSQQNSGL